MKAKIYYRRTEEGRWLAATAKSPFFCLEADSLSEVKRLAREACRVWEDYKRKTS